MSDRHRKPLEPEPDPDPDPNAEPAAAPPDPQPAGALVEPPEEAVGRLEGEVAELKDKYLRLAAEFDNFRKRAVKDRTELWGKAQADVVQNLVDALDDLARFAHVDPAEADAKTIHDGVDMVERKIWKQLETLGVKRMDQAGVPFDPSVHEAVMTAAASEPAQDHTVGQVLQAGYRLGETLIRPARVSVLVWQGEQGRGAEEA